MYSAEEVAPYLGLIMLMLDELGGQFTYDVEALANESFNADRVVVQTTDVMTDRITIRFASRKDVYLDEH
jgi:hypothetical protein